MMTTAWLVALSPHERSRLHREQGVLDPSPLRGGRENRARQLTTAIKDERHRTRETCARGASPAVSST